MAGDGSRRGSCAQPAIARRLTVSNTLTRRRQAVGFELFMTSIDLSQYGTVQFSYSLLDLIHLSSKTVLNRSVHYIKRPAREYKRHQATSHLGYRLPAVPHAGVCRDLNC